MKWDGYRLAVQIADGAVRILTRGGARLTHRYLGGGRPAGRTAILEGKAVVLDEHGVGDFGSLRALGGRGGKCGAGEVILNAFDLLYLDGHDLRSMPLEDRRVLLADLLEGRSAAVRVSEEIVADGAAFLTQACAMGLEGIIAKRRDAPYRSGRGGDRLKIKCVQSETS